MKPRAKHPIKVRILGSISCRGATQIVIFTGTMMATRYCSILEAGFMPFLREVFPDSHLLQQDNDPKHTSCFAREFLAENAVNWWRTPAERLDLIPIENVCLPETNLPLLLCIIRAMPLIILLTSCACGATVTYSRNAHLRGNGKAKLKFAV